MTDLGQERHAEAEPPGSQDRPKKGKGPLDLVQEAMGSMGPWHIVIAVALSLVKFPVAWHQLSIVFLAPPVDFICVSPLPADNETMINRCSVDVGNGTFEKCTKFHYDRSIFRETIVTQWNLVCDRQQLSNLAQSATMFGILIGNMIFSAMSDRIGRKIPLMIAILLQSMTGLLTVYSPWYEMFLIFKLISTVATGGTMLISFVILMEIAGPKWRSPLSVLFHVPFLIGFLLNPLISYLTRTWYGFQMAVSIPPIFLLSYYWIIPESPRWLLAVGRTSEAEFVLTRAAEKNSVPLANVTAAIESYTGAEKKKSGEPEKKYNVTHLFRTPNLCLKTVCVCVNWFVCGMCFFGLAQYMGHLKGNIFVNTALSAAVELPGTLIVLFLISRVSRLRILMGGSLVSGVTLLLIMLFEDATTRVTLATIGIAGMSVSFPTVYLYSSEVFPTVVRNVGIGAGSICARVGSMIAPFIATKGHTHPWLPPLLFGLGPIIGASLCLLLPETMNCELPETIEDGENFGKKKSKKSEA